MAPMRGWLAWNESGEVYSSADLKWQDLPDGIVGVVVYLEPPYRRIIAGHDWIWLQDGEFRVVDNHAEWGQWAVPPTGIERALLKRGAGVTDDLWAEIQQAMVEARACP